MLGGHHGLTREQIYDSQRERLLAAIVVEVATHGYGATKISEVGKRAAVSTRDFYKLYEGKEELFLAAFDTIRNHLEELVRAAAASETEWPHQVVAGIRATLEFFSTEPDIARFILVESVAATPATAIRYREAVLACEPGLAAGRAELSDPDALLPGTESSIVGGVISLVTHRVVAGQSEQLLELLPDMVGFALGPYLGDERATELAASARAA